MAHSRDSSRSTVPFVQGETLIAVIETGQASWLVPGVERQPLKKLAVDQAERYCSA